jgi:hypothetical protein
VICGHQIDGRGHESLLNGVARPLGTWLRSRLQ